MPSGHLDALQDLLDDFDRRALAAFRRVGANEKADGTAVTEVDTETTREVQSKLKARFPEYGLLIEEDPVPHLPDAEFQWVVDPLDGTAMFVRGFPAWGLGIGLMQGTTPREGHLSFPALGERYACIEGRITFNGEPFVPPPAPDVAQTRNLLVGSDLLKELRLERLHGYKVRNFGTNLYHLICTALGRAEGMISPRSYMWDIVPALPFTRSRGLVERFLDGRPFDLEADWVPDRRAAPLPALVVARPEVAEEVIRQLR